MASLAMSATLLCRRQKGFLRFKSNALLTREQPKIASVFVAVLDPLWKAAMQDEYDLLVENGTWSLVPAADLPVNSNIVDCKCWCRAAESGIAGGGFSAPGPRTSIFSGRTAKLIQIQSLQWMPQIRKSDLLCRNSELLFRCSDYAYDLKKFQKF